MTKEYLPLSLRSSSLGIVLCFAELVVTLDVHLRSFWEGLQVIKDVGIEAEDTVPARFRGRTRFESEVRLT